MASPVRKIFSGSSLGGTRYEEMSASARARTDLLELGERGFRILLTDEVRWDFKPWLIAEDESVWLIEGGTPLSGHQPDKHALLVDRHNNWTFVTAAAATGRKDAPRDGRELEQRRKREEEAKRKTQEEHERALAQRRETAPPVTTGRLDPQMHMTLREAAQRIHNAGGRLEGGDSLVVYLPPAHAVWGAPEVSAAKLLYIGERAILEALARGEEIPDREVTPTGALV
jgi:hypothetical protein